jgi:nucleoside-diphosphate-sugar epimerase
MLKMFVTGGAGSVGSHINGYYAKKGLEVIVFDNLLRTKSLGKKHTKP